MFIDHRKIVTVDAFAPSLHRIFRAMKHPGEFRQGTLESAEFFKRLLIDDNLRSANFTRFYYSKRLRHSAILGTGQGKLQGDYFSVSWMRIRPNWPCAMREGCQVRFDPMPSQLRPNPIRPTGVGYAVKFDLDGPPLVKHLAVLRPFRRHQTAVVKAAIAIVNGADHLAAPAACFPAALHPSHLALLSAAFRDRRFLPSAFTPSGSGRQFGITLFASHGSTPSRLVGCRPTDPPEESRILRGIGQT